MGTRRQVLEEIKCNRSTNAGLWFDKYIETQDRGDTENRRKLVYEVTDIAIPEGYRHRFACWQEALQQYGAECREAQTQGRLVIGLGSESILETSVSLHHTYGVPYIPGTVLKGLAASFARQYLGDDWKEDSDTRAFQTMFGNTDNSGYVIFFDAMPLPGAIRLVSDVISVHHKDYYGEKDGSPPADRDEPTPVPFLSITGSFLFALAGPSDWVSSAFKILGMALWDLGVGAKTSSGYGRMQLIEPSADPGQLETERLIAGIESLRMVEVAGSIDKYYQLWRDSQLSSAQKRQVAEAIVNKVKAVGRGKSSKDKKWYQELMETLNYKP